MSTTALAAVVAKLTGLGFAGKAAVGIAVAAGAIVAAPAVAHQVAEAPAPAETAVVEPVVDDPTDPADPTGDQDQVRDEDCDQVPDQDGDQAQDQDQIRDQDQDEVCDPDQTQDRDRDGELPEAASFGQGVAADARDGGVDGQEVKVLAQERNELRRGDETVPEAPVEDVTDDTTDTDTDTVEVPGPQAPVLPAEHGRRP